MYDKQQRLVEILSDFLIADASGRDLGRVVCDKPSSGRFCIGTLLPRKKEPKPDLADPSEVGLEVVLPGGLESESYMEIKASGSFYYLVFPTLIEQTSERIFSESDESDEESGYAISNPSRLRRVWKKAGPFEIVTRIPLGDLPENGKLEVPDGELLAKLAKKQWGADPDKYRIMKFESKRQQDRDIQMLLPEGALRDEKSLRDYLNASYTGDSPEPLWKTGIEVRVRAEDNGRQRLTIVLQNRVEEDGRSPSDTDNTVFESCIQVNSSDFSFCPITLDRLRDGYRYSGEVPGIGVNAVAVSDSKAEHRKIRIEHTPRVLQKRLVPKSFEATLEQLSTDPIPHLQMLERKMKSHLEQLCSKYREREDLLTEDGKFMFSRDIDLFSSELSRFSEGVRILTSIPEVLEAFKLTNLAFWRSRSRFPTWYRFQIVFLVMMVPDIASTYFESISNKRDQVDVVYFPTGGGKTEAYLSVVVFQIFLDRFMGKKSGISAITRFPLRLLSLQQTQRIADIFASAEILRRSHDKIGSKEHDPFSVGYFVGKANTPNALYKPPYKGQGGEDMLSPIIDDPREGDKYRILDHCPFCGKNAIKVIADNKEVRIKLVCEECGEVIPVYLSDDEIYRYLPAFIVGTLDKMTSASWSPHFRQIFGCVTHRCPDHGFISGGRCFYAGSGNLCTRSESEYIPVSLQNAPPSLIIQDEMHLVRESLGCFDSHYETLLENLLINVTGGKKRFKVIAASATISDVEHQVEQLYMKEGHEFPYRGPDRKESFYYRENEDELARIIVGMVPHHKTMLLTVLDLISAYACKIQTLMKDPSKLIEAGIALTNDEAEVLLRDYWVMISYNLKKMQGDTIEHSIRTMRNPNLIKRGLKEIRVQAMTGEVTFARVREVLEMLQSKENGMEIDLITATSMISHGVDVDSLNMIMFQGMPSNVAEYIQAYSRVGRKYPGIVISVLDQLKERDISHYKYFLNYHDLSDLLIEPVPINRWSKFSIERTLPGIFCASLISYFDPIIMNYDGIYMSDKFNRALQSGQLREEDIKAFIIESYKIKDDDRGEHFENIIRNRVVELINEIRAAKGKEFIPSLLSDSPMTSLRDTDIQIDIEPDRESFAPMRGISTKSVGGVEK